MLYEKNAKILVCTSFITFANNILFFLPFTKSMKKISCLVFTILLLWGCGDDKNTPDISGIQVKTEVQRFDVDFFAIDTLDLNNHLARLHQKYPEFLSLYLENIIRLSGPGEVNGFYRLYNLYMIQPSFPLRILNPYKNNWKQLSGM